MTSYDVIRLVRRRLGGIRAGHAGTLDPFATGLLPVLVGRATRLARFVASGRKRYRASVRFGWATDTDDRTGRPIGDRLHPAPDRASLSAVLPAFTGEIEQRPPAFSAKRIAGQRAYRLARQGKPVAAAPVRVHIHALDLENLEEDTARITCEVGPGTYIRALARDLGERLGGAAHLSALRRTAVGPFAVDEATPPGELPDRESVLARLLPPLEALRAMPRLPVPEAAARALGHGRPALPQMWRDAGGPALPNPNSPGELRAAVARSGRTGSELVAVVRPQAGGFQPVLVWRASG